MMTPHPSTTHLIACPHCDALLEQVAITEAQRALCPRCASVLVSPRQRSFLHVVSLSCTATILMFAAIFFPFLGVASHGLSHTASVFEVAMAFAHGWLVPLTAVLLAAIVGLPTLRFALLIYTLWPLSFGRPPWRHARFAFRLSEQLTPWSMAEIFIVGTAVALVKIGGLASVSLGPAFWAFCGLIIVTVLENSFMSKWSIWEAIDRK